MEEEEEDAKKTSERIIIQDKSNEFDGREEKRGPLMIGDIDISSFINSNTTPSNDVIQQLFSQILSLQLIPTHQHSKLSSTTSLTKKWEIIVAYYNLHTTTDENIRSSTVFNTYDEELLKNLMVNKLNILLILQLKSRICTGNKLWCENFLKVGNGFEIILNLIDSCLLSYPFGEYHAAIIYELILSLKLLLNNGTHLVIQQFLQISFSIRILISSLIFEWKILTLQVLEILCVLCDYSSEVALQIIQQIKYLSFSQHKLPFEYLIQNIIDCDLDVKATIIQFLNHMICSVSNIQIRIIIRNEIQSLQFYLICELVLKDLSFEYQQIKSLNSQNIRQSLHHMSSIGNINPSASSPSSPSPSSSAAAAAIPSSSNSSTSPTRVQRIRQFFESNQSTPIMKWIRRKRIKAKHLLTSNTLIDSTDSSSSAERNKSMSQMSSQFLQTMSLSSVSNQSAEPLLYSHYSDEGKTPIRPYLGIMCGNLYLIKNHFSFRDLYHIGTTLKQRYFELLGHTFSWWNIKRKEDNPLGIIQTSQIKSIRIHSYNEEINQVCPYTFELVLITGHAYSYGCQDLVTYNNWLIALNYVFNHHLLSKSSYVLIPKELSTDDFKLAKIKFQKQLTVYQVLDQEDYQKYQLTFGPKGLILPSKVKINEVTEDGLEMKVDNENGNENEIGNENDKNNDNDNLPSLSTNSSTITLQLTNYLELMQYLYQNMLSYHQDSKLFNLLQELILVPLGRPYGDIFWNILLSYCQCMRNSRQLIPEMATSLTPSLTQTEILSEINKYVVNNLTLDECLQEVINLESSTEGKQSHELRQLIKTLFSKDAEILRLKDEIELLKISSAGSKSRTLSSLSDYTLQTPTIDEFDNEKNEISSKKSVARLVEEYNSGTSSSISPKSTSQNSVGKSRHRANPSRDIRVTYLRQAEGKDHEVYSQKEKQEGEGKAHERHVSFPQWSTDEGDESQERDKKATTPLADLTSQVRALQQELQRSQFENEKLQQEIRMNKTMSVRANSVVKELFTKNAEVLRLQDEVKYLRKYIEENSLPLPTMPLDNSSQLTTTGMTEATSIVSPSSASPVTEKTTLDIYGTTQSSEDSKVILRQDSNPEMSTSHLDTSFTGLSATTTAATAISSTLTPTKKRRESDSSEVLKSKSTDDQRIPSVRMNSNPLFRKILSVNQSNTPPATQPSSSNEGGAVAEKSSVQVTDQEVKSSDQSTSELDARNTTTHSEKEEVSRLTKEPPKKVGKLKNMSKDSPLANLFGAQLPPPPVPPPPVDVPVTVPVAVSAASESKEDNKTASNFKEDNMPHPLPPPLTTQSQVTHDAPLPVVGKLKKNEASPLSSLFANRLPIAEKPSLSLQPPLPPPKHLHPNNGKVIIPLAVPNSSRTIPIPPYLPGTTPPPSSVSLISNGLKLAVPSSTRPIPPPPTPPFNPADYPSRQFSTSTHAVPSLPVMKKKTPEYITSHKPKCKMKGVFWNKLSAQQCSKSLFWSSITVKQLDHLEIDYSLLEESFCELKASSTTPGSGAGGVGAGASTQGTDKPKTITLFDSRRTQNILISLNKLKLTTTNCLNMIGELNPQILTIERCDLISTLVPTAEECKQLMTYTLADLPLLGKAEQFLYHLQGIYRLKERLECHKLIFSWNSTADSITGEINIIHSACQELLSNDCKSKLLTIFSVILAVGNFMNGGSSRIATGITLESIIKLSTVKTTKEGPVLRKNDTLLHYVVRQLEQNYKSSLSFYHQWKCVLTASEISFTQIVVEITRLQKELNQIQAELNQLIEYKRSYLLTSTSSGSAPSSGSGVVGEEDQTIKFIENAEDRFQPFLFQGQNLLKYIRTNLISVENILKSTMEIFGETFTSSLSPDFAEGGGGSGAGSGGGAAGGGAGGGTGEDKCQQFFKILNQVMNLFQKIEQENEQINGMKQKLALKAAAGAGTGTGMRNEQENQQISITKAGNKNQQQSTPQPSQQPPTAKNIFDNFHSNENESTEKIVEIFRSKLPLRRVSAV